MHRLLSAWPRHVCAGIGLHTSRHGARTHLASRSALLSLYAVASRSGKSPTMSSTPSCSLTCDGSGLLQRQGLLEVTIRYTHMTAEQVKPQPRSKRSSRARGTSWSVGFLSPCPLESSSTDPLRPPLSPSDVQPVLDCRYQVRRVNPGPTQDTNKSSLSRLSEAAAVLKSFNCCRRASMVDEWTSSTVRIDHFDQLQTR